MATRFDSIGARVTSRDPATATRTRERDELDLDLDVRALMRRQDLLPVPMQVPANVPRQLPIRAMGSAMATWLAIVFATCYVALPLGMALLGLNGGVLAAVPYALPAFLMASFVAVVGALVVRPAVRLDWRGPRDPVISATLGSLGVWALIHNTSSLLVPFSDMTPIELLSFVALNVLESTMLGMMFASFTRKRSVALALGGGFQLLVMGLVLTLMAL